ncbi:MAG: substrate-binding domain-containing protein, partial [Clostridia bacterium]|nr:substrate-binding domain-containing protein [Clostridia bacterium]
MGGHAGGEQLAVLQGQPQDGRARVQHQRQKVALDAGLLVGVGVHGDGSGGDDVVQQEGGQVPQDGGQQVRVKGLEREGPDAEVNLQHSVHSEQHCVGDDHGHEGSAQTGDDRHGLEHHAVGGQGRAFLGLHAQEHQTHDGGGDQRAGDGPVGDGVDANGSPHAVVSVHGGLGDHSQSSGGHSGHDAAHKALLALLQRSHNDRGHTDHGGNDAGVEQDVHGGGVGAFIHQGSEEDRRQQHGDGQHRDGDDLLGALDARGRRVPEDCSVIAIDGIEFSEYLRPTLTTLCQPLEEM